MSPDGTRVYANTNPIAVIDAEQGQVSATIPLPFDRPPVAIGLSPDGARAYALGSMFVQSASGFGSWANVIFVVETRTGAVLATIGLTATGVPSDITLTPDGRFAYVALQRPPQSEHGPPTPGHVVIVDTATHQEVASFVDAPEEIAIAPNGAFAYVATDRTTITVIDAVHQVVTGTLSAGFAQSHVAVTPDSAYVYATGSSSSEVAIIHAADQTADAVYIGGFPGAIAIGSVEEPLCPGDCDHRGVVAVDDLVRGVNIVLGNLGVDTCPSLDRNSDGTVLIDDLVTAIDAALDGC